MAFLVLAAEADEPLPPLAREMLSAHNAARSKVGVTPLKWSSALAVRAEEWARTLASTGESKMEGIPGQNIGYSSPAGTVKGAAIVGAWAAEAANYDREKNACIDTNLRCHHFTQVVWRDSNWVGCGWARDAKRDIWVCDYDPPGNNVAEKAY
jgi:uncharacterized protein YkwD